MIWLLLKKHWIRTHFDNEQPSKSPMKMMSIEGPRTLQSKRYVGLMKPSEPWAMVHSLPSPHELMKIHQEQMFSCWSLPGAPWRHPMKSAGKGSPESDAGAPHVDSIQLWIVSVTYVGFFSQNLQGQSVHSHTSSLATEVIPRLCSQACLQPHLHFQELCMCPEWGFPPEPSGRVPTLSPTQSKGVQVEVKGLSWPLQSVTNCSGCLHMGIFWSFGAIYSVRYRRPSAATVLKENLTKRQLEHFPHIRCHGGSWRTRLQPRRRLDLWGQGGEVTNTRVLRAALKLIAGKLDLGLQDGKVGDIAPEWPVATSPDGFSRLNQSQGFVKDTGYMFQTVMGSILERFDFDFDRVLSVFMIIVATSHSWVQRFR